MREPVREEPGHPAITAAEADGRPAILQKRFSCGPSHIQTDYRDNQPPAAAIVSTFTTAGKPCTPRAPLIPRSSRSSQDRPDPAQDWS